LTGRTEQSYIQEIIRLKAENAALKERIKVLEKRLKELECRQGINSKNSSKPPSMDPRGITASAQKRKRKKCGAQKSHKPYMKSLFPESLVQRFIPLKANVCACGSTNLEDTTEPLRRHQYVDILCNAKSVSTRVICGFKKSLTNTKLSGIISPVATAIVPVCEWREKEKFPAF